MFKRKQLKRWQIEDFLKASFGEFIQEALKAEMDEELGYTRYDYREKEGTNSRN